MRPATFQAQSIQDHRRRLERFVVSIGRFRPVARVARPGPLPPPSLPPAALDEPREEPATSTTGPGLSPRMRQTLALLLQGHSEKQVAANLKIRPNTVHVYVKSLYRHYNVESRAELLAIWVRVPAGQ